MGLSAGPQPPAMPELFVRETDPDQPAVWSPTDRAILILVIVGVVLAVALFIMWA